MDQQLKDEVKALRGELWDRKKTPVTEAHAQIALAAAAIERAVSKQLRKRGLSHSEFMVLYALVDYGGTVTLSRMTKKLLFTRQAIALTTRGLEKRGLVSRDGVKSDLRKIQVSLTEDGFKFIKGIALSPDRKKLHDALVYSLNEDEVSQLISTMTRVMDNLRRRDVFS